MLGRPVRLVIASPDLAVTRGLRELLAGHGHRVVVVEPASPAEPADVVLHDTADGQTRTAVLRRTGAAGWVPLHLGVEHLVSLVEAAAVASSETNADDADDADDASQDAAQLSPREVEVLALIAEGLTNQEIADRVFVSINSVKTYIRSAYRKIGVNSRSQAVVWGMRNGVVRPPVER